MDMPRLTVSDSLAELMSYDKLAGPVPRILILESDYWIDDACIRAGERLGWDIVKAPVVKQGVLSRDAIETLLRALTQQKPDFILTVNLCGMDVDGLFARFFGDIKIPFVTWFVDDPRIIMMDYDIYSSLYSVAITWERAYIQPLQDLGFPYVHQVPLGVDATRFDSGPADAWRFPPTFVGHSMVNFAEEEWAKLQDEPTLAAAITKALAAGRVTRETFAKGLPAMLDGEVIRAVPRQKLNHAELYLCVEGTRRIRHAFAKALIPEEVVMRGEEGWQKVTPFADGPVNYKHDIGIFYRECEVNLNTTSIQMLTTVNQRVFDCPASGGFLLTDAQPEIPELYVPDKEIVTYGSHEECIDKLRFYRAHPEARRPIIEAGRRRAIEEHSYERRLQRIVGIVREHFTD